MEQVMEQLESTTLHLYVSTAAYRKTRSFEPRCHVLQETLKGRLLELTKTSFVNAPV